MTSIRLSLLLCAASSALALPPGFEMKEFAGPPNADYPAAITAAANGDVYVSSDQNGSLGHDKNMGRIIRCTDTDGDGKADKFVHFVPNVDSPRGGHFVGGTLYLIHPPFLSSFRDTNGDGVADEKKTLVTGLGGGIEHPRGADHTTNGVRMGIDGWLYISVGDFGTFPAKGTDGSSFTLYGGGVIRVRPDGSQVEPYALMVRNICDTAISPELDLFSRDNTNDGKGWNTRFHHYTSLGDHGYPRLYQNFADEAIRPLADYGGGSGTGALWLSEPGFPKEFQDALFSTDWTTGNVYYHPHERSGASFKVDQKVFQQLPRATDIDVDGNSRLYLADWRNGGFSYTKDAKVGLIHLVTVPGEKPAKYTDVTKASDKNLVTLLGSPSAVQRLEAQREILRRGRKSIFARGTFTLAKNQSASVAARTAAIFTLKQLYGVDSNKPLSELVADDTVREQALRALADRRDELEGVDPELFVKALKDKNPRVVLQAIIGLERLKAKDKAAAILAASSSWNEESVSPRLQHTAVAALAALGDVAPLLKAAGDTTTRTTALRALAKIHTDEAVDGLIGLVNATNDQDLLFDGITALARLSHQEKPWDLKSWWNTRPDDRGPYYEPITWQASPRIVAAIEQNFSRVNSARQNALLDLLGKNRLPVAELKLSGVDPVLAALGTKKPDSAQLLLLVEAAKDAKRPFAQRVECYKALANGGENPTLPQRVAVLSAWSAEKDIPAEYQQHVSDFISSPTRGNQVKDLRELAAKQDNVASTLCWKALLTVFQSPLAKPEVKEAIKAEVEKTPREVGFFNAIADLKLKGFEKQIEAGLHWDNAELINAAKNAQTATAGTTHSGKKVAELPIADVAKAAMSGKGDAAVGERLYISQGCIACHAVDLKAEQKGPYLGAAGAKFTRDYLIDSILEPNKVVAQGFQTTTLKLKDGTMKMGFVTSEADGIVELRDIAGQVSKVKREDVTEEAHLPNSMMPPGLAAGLTVEDFTSLIEYLASLKSTGG